MRRICLKTQNESFVYVIKNCTNFQLHALRFMLDSANAGSQIFYNDVPEIPIIFRNKFHER